jgi:hypothetical protein
MPREAKKKIINGHEWEVYPWDGMHGLRMQARLSKVIGPVVGQVVGSNQEIMDADVSAIANTLIDRIDNDTPQLIRDMLYGAFVDGKDISQDRVFNEHFAANFAELYKGLAFILEVNFGDFFELAGAIGVRDTGGKDQAKDYRET